MKKFLIIISLVLILFSCDRFEHVLEPSVSNIGLDEFADSMTDLFVTTNQNNYLELSFLFSDNYYNQDVTKDDKVDYFANFFLIDPNTTLIANNITISPSLNVSWHFTATNSNFEILADTTFVDFLIEEKEGFVFYGNQNNKRKVLVELFTGAWCSNCPNAEEALHNLRMQYGSRFSYVEYHWNDELETNFTFDLFQYYPNAAGFPFGVINGNAGFIYSAPSIEEVQTEIETAIIPLLQEPLSVLLTDIQTTLTDTLLTGSVQIEVDPSIPTENLSLVVVLMEDYNEEYPNDNGDPHHNIALKRITVDISAINRSDTVEFLIPDSDVLPTWYENELPEDLTLVLWVQTLETPYNQNSCAVHNVIEISINN
ncbi:MAG: hypothetical protein J7K29_00065 [Candidatus Cloacimonetes bacterium]|nr:hypothetical protein [Candidatus Cloacimonadota bacterium]